MYLILRVSRAYGRRNVYPACSKSNLLLGLTGAKTFSQEALIAIQELGYIITYEGGLNG